MDKSNGFVYIATGSLQVLSDIQIKYLNDLFDLMSYDFLISSKVLTTNSKNVKVVP